ncbi:EamA family transporter [Odoribacter laneus]|uniref:EamA family transporter n=1 Tax=Odoribacter laneus TaxID=626933 RepID=UPI003AB59677
MKGSAYALGTVIIWSLLGVVNRYCILKFDVNIIVFTSFLVFSAGVALLLIRQQVAPESWKSGVRYSWLYTIMQITKSFFMISTYLYITTTETSILINIEVVISYLLAYLFFKRIPHRGDYWGILVISGGFILFIYSLSPSIRIPAVVLLLIAAAASCIRSIVVEETTLKNPDTTVRQKCGISGFTMFIAGLALIIFFFFIAILKFVIGSNLPAIFSFLHYLPTISDVLNPATIISACIAGFFINAASVYFFYAALKWTKTETFMAFRVFQPALTYSFELFAAGFYTAMKPNLDIKDYLLGGFILFGSVLILVMPTKATINARSKSFITE